MATALSVNLNKIALIRNSREGSYPDIVEHGKICLAAGADGITVHPRPDQRHIRIGDIKPLGQLCRQWSLQDPHKNIEFNIEGNPFANACDDYPGFIALAIAACPDQVTLVPDSNEQLTSDHGFDLHTVADKLRPIIQQMKDIGARVSLFMNPDPEQISLAHSIGANRIEFYTGPYASAYKAAHSNNKNISITEQQHLQARLQKQFDKYQKAASHANTIGLGINAGHDLNLDNLALFLRIPNILEVSIGHALTVDAIKMGMSNAVGQYHKICQ